VEGGEEGSGAETTGGQYEIVRSGRTANSGDSRAAYDGDPSTVWATDGQAAPRRADVWFDLGEERAIGSVRWLPSDWAEGSTLSIEVSNDRRSWDEVAKVEPGTPGEWQSIPIGLTARYVRLRFDNPDHAAVIGFVAEVEFLP
jgi:F5/8 type C domain